MSRTIRVPFSDISFFEKTRLIKKSGAKNLTMPIDSQTIYFRNTAGINIGDFIVIEAFESEDAEIVRVQDIDREGHMVDLVTPTLQEHAIGVLLMKTPYNKVKVYKGTSTNLATHTTEVTPVGGADLRPDNAYTYAIDSLGTSTDYYSYKYMNDALASVVIGTDAKNYNCKLSHTAAASNQPVTGASWTTYWEECATVGSAWVLGTSYVGVTYGTQTLFAESDYEAILTVDQLKNWFMFGLDLTDDDGYPFPNSMFEFAIRAAIDSLEKSIGIKIKPTQILQEFQDYHAADYRDFAFLQLNNWPIISVENIEIQYPTSDSPVVFPIEWVQINAAHGQLHLIPTQGSLSTILMGRGGDYLNFVWRGYDFMPNLWRINYTAGFPAGTCPNDVRGVIGMLACFWPLNVAGDLVGGIAVASKSIGVDGLSQSLNTTSSPENAGYCLVGESEINTIDGKVSIRNLVGKNPITVIKIKDGFILQRTMKVWKTFKNKSVSKVTFDDNSYFVLTKDHPVKTPFGDKRVQELGIGDVVVGDRLYEVKEVKLDFSRADVYDAEMPYLHYFSVNNIIVHNSARLRQYERQLKIDIPKLKQFYAGIRFIAA